MLTTANYSDDWDGLAPVDPPRPPTDDELREQHAVDFFRHAAEENDPIDAGDYLSIAIGEICRIDGRHVLNHRHWREVHQRASSVQERLAGLPDSHAPMAGKGVLAFLRVVDELFEVGDIRAAYRQFNEDVNTRHTARVAGRTLCQLSRDRVLSTRDCR